MLIATKSMVETETQQALMLMVLQQEMKIVGDLSAAHGSKLRDITQTFCDFIWCNALVATRLIFLNSAGMRVTHSPDGDLAASRAQYSFKDEDKGPERFDSERESFHCVS